MELYCRKEYQIVYIWKSTVLNWTSKTATDKDKIMRLTCREKKVA
jgi:hypothetical protein